MAAVIKWRGTYGGLSPLEIQTLSKVPHQGASSGLVFVSHQSVICGQDFDWCVCLCMCVCVWSVALRLLPSSGAVKHMCRFHSSCWKTQTPPLSAAASVFPLTCSLLHPSLRQSAAPSQPASLYFRSRSFCFYLRKSNRGLE